MQVYRTYDRKELADQYDPRKWMRPDDGDIAKADVLSARARETLKSHVDIAYGRTPDERLDIFVPRKGRKKKAPVRVFFHGGGWARNTKETAAYPAELHVAAGALFVAVNFAKIDTVSLDEIIRQSRSAIAWVYNNIAEYGGDPDRIYVCGKSSGGQQAGMAMCTDWTDYRLPSGVIKGAVLVSGIYDLEPLSLTERGKETDLDLAAVKRLSPIHHIPENGCALILAAAEFDSEEVRRQARDFAEAWTAAGNPCAQIAVAGVDHFSIGAPMSDAQSELGQATLAQMNLA